MSPRRRKFAVFTAALALALLVAYGAWVTSRSHDLYVAAKSGWRGWRGRVLRSDPVLGLSNLPGALGAETYPIGPDVPSRIDQDGFRVPLDAPDPPSRERPLVLALGCSFTYGSSVLAEEAYAQVVARELGGSCLNAGICGAGAAQMLLLARELIPRHRPDWVLAQYSGWLADRSRASFAPTFAGLVPTPRFVRAAGGVELLPPAFGAIAFDLPVAEFRETPRGAGDFARFLLRVGVPLHVHDDLAALVLRLRGIGAAEPASRLEIEAAVYPEIVRLCQENGARLVLVWLEGRAPGDSWDVPAGAAQLGVPVVAATKRLVEELAEPTREAFVSTYTLMRGDPPRCVDGHPNARAHALVADEILRAIR